MFEELTPDAIETVRASLESDVLTTPTVRFHGTQIEDAAPGAEVYLKLEMFQYTGTFKARGAMNVVRNLDVEARSRGITAVSAGNHAIAAAYAAAKFGTSARIFMPKTAKQVRIDKATSYGAELIFCDTQTEMFERAEQAQQDEGRTFVHPFEGPLTVQGTATVGLEIHQQAPQLDIMILPIGGGGLCAGVAAFLKQVQPQIKIVGVEPEGANTMALSFANGGPVVKESVSTIADSLAPPKSEPYTYSVCRQFVDELIQVPDELLIQGMRVLRDDLKLMVEPAGAATTAALLSGQLGALTGLRVGAIVCGANIAFDDYQQLVGSD